MENRIKNSSISLAQSWFVWFFAASLYTYQFVIRVAAGPLAQPLMHEFSIDSYAVGVILGLYYTAYTFLQIPAGSFLDKFGPRSVVTTAFLLCATGCFLFATAQAPWIAGVGRFMMGMGSACGFLSSFKVATSMFPNSKVPFIIGITVLMGTMGGLFAGKPLAMLVEMFGWRAFFNVLGIMGVIFAIFSGACMRKPSNELAAYLRMQRGEGTDARQAGFWEGILLLVKNKQVWLLAILTFSLYSPTSSFADMWGNSMMETKYGLKPGEGSLVPMLYYIGFGLGSFSYSSLLHYFKSYKPCFFIAAVGGIVFFSAAIYLPAEVLSYYMALGLLSLTGFCLANVALAFSSAADVVPGSVSSTAGGVINMVCMFSGTVFQPLIGWLARYHAGSEVLIVNGAPSYSIADYQFGFIGVIVALIAGFLIIPFIRNTYKKQA